MILPFQGFSSTRYLIFIYTLLTLFIDFYLQGPSVSKNPRSLEIYLADYVKSLY